VFIHPLWRRQVVKEKAEIAKRTQFSTQVIVRKQETKKKFPIL
jgi:hypothetical protein